MTDQQQAWEEAALKKYPVSHLAAFEEHQALRREGYIAALQSVSGLIGEDREEYLEAEAKRLSEVATYWLNKWHDEAKPKIEQLQNRIAELESKLGEQDKEGKK